MKPKTFLSLLLILGFFCLCLLEVVEAQQQSAASGSTEKPTGDQAEGCPHAKRAKDSQARGTMSALQSLNECHQHGHPSSSKSSYKLTYFNFRWLAEPIRYLLSYQGEEFEDVRLDTDEWKNGIIDKSAYRYAKLPFLEETEKKCIDDDKLGGGGDEVCDTAASSSSSSILKLSQSFTILRYLGKKFNLVGRSLREEAKGDEISDCLKDILNEVVELFTDDEKKKEQLIKNIVTLTIPRYFDVFEKDLKDKKAMRDTNDKMMPLVGDSLTWLDFQLAHFSELFEEFIKEKNGDSQDVNVEELFDRYPMIREHRKWVFSLEGVKEWRERRPVTEH